MKNKLDDYQLDRLLNLCGVVKPRPEGLIREEFIVRAKALIEFLSPTGENVDKELYGEDLYDVFTALERAVRFAGRANEDLQRKLKEERSK
jgi:hypothetical protein